MAQTTPLPQFTVHDRLRKAREFAGLEQGELADLLEVARSTVSNYETGATTRLKSYVLRRWAELCNVDYEWILSDVWPIPTDDDTSGLGFSDSA